MALLTTARGDSSQTIKRYNWPFKAGSKAFRNGIACLDTANHCIDRGASGNANLIPVGGFMNDIDNSAATVAGVCYVTLNREIDCEWLDNATGAGKVTLASNLFTNVYLADDHTVTTVTGSAIAGRVMDVDSGRGVLVWYNQGP